MLLDEINLGSGFNQNIFKSERERLAQARVTAESFVFDRDASQRLGRFLAEDRLAIIRNSAFAIQPFPVTYVEFDFKAFTIGRGVPQDPFMDSRLGFLFENGRLHTLAEADSDIAFMPLTVLLSPQSPSEVRRIFGDHPRYLEIRDAYLLGGVRPGRSISGLANEGEWTGLGADEPIQFNNMPDGLDRTEWCDQFGLELISKPGERIGVEHLIGIAFMGSGNLIFALSALLMLNQTRLITMHHQDAQRRFHRGKMLPYRAHRRITINLANIEPITIGVATGAGTPRRAHSVMGCWCHRPRVRPPCDHDYQKLDEEGHRWRCSKCETLRYWRESHVRGDATLGFITHDYEAIYKRGEVA